MMKPTFTIIIPTFNNPEFLNPCVRSILATGALNGLGNLIIVNNGKQPIKEFVAGVKNIEVLEPGENLGWERGLEYGLKHTDAPFVCFQNDDTHIPRANANIYNQLLHPFRDSNVAAVGPATTVASGWHTVFSPNAPLTQTEVSFLIFFTVMVRREHLIQAGGIDTTAPGGDDFDLSIRFRKLGKKLVINPNAFLIHHGFKTGTRVRGDHNTANGWNSKEMTDRTNQWLIQKHGFKTYLETIHGLSYAPKAADSRDLEGDAVREFASGEVVYELGCGFRKSVPQALGIDRASDAIPHVPGGESVADIIADVAKPLPVTEYSADCLIARHILEHCVDSVETLKNWNNALKMGGKLIIAVPNEDVLATIPLNPEHVHAFTPESLNNLIELCGFKKTGTIDPQNGVSFVSCFEKVFHMERKAERELVHA